MRRNVLLPVANKRSEIAWCEKSFAVISSAAVQLCKAEFGVTFALPIFLCQDGRSKETKECLYSAVEEV